LLGNASRAPSGGQHRRKRERVGDDDHQHDPYLGGVDQYFGNLSHADVAVDEHRYKKRINGGYRGRFGGGENTTIDTTEDNDDEHQPPKGIAPGNQHFLKRGPRLARKILDPSHHVDGHHQNQPKQDPWQHAGHEQIANRGFGRGTVNHQHDRGRNENTQRAGIAHHSGGKRFWISRTHHAGDDDR